MTEENWNLDLTDIDGLLEDIARPVSNAVAPKTILRTPVLKFANAAWQIPNDDELISNVTKNGNMFAGVELRTRDSKVVNLRKILPGWDVEQNTNNDQEGGSGFAVKNGTGIHIAGSRLIQLSGKGSNVQERYMRTVTIVSKRPTTRYGVYHLATRSQTPQHNQGMHRLIQWVGHVDKMPYRWMIVGDGNEPVRVIVEAIKRSGVRVGGFAGDGVMNVIWSHKDWKHVGVTAKTFGRSDHAVMTVREEE